jgi:SAM-dependent methyltransferase
VSLAIGTPSAVSQVERTRRDKSCLLRIFSRQLQELAVDRDQAVLALGGEEDDTEILTALGFRNIVLSNLQSGTMSLDAENIELPDDSYPIVFAHAVLHHCRCPHKALGEMVRISRDHVFFLEPNDSWAMRTLVRAGFSFPYEFPAVVYHGYVAGGMRNGPIPNYIYRWTEHEVRKGISVYHPERQFRAMSYPYWDFYVNKYDLLARRESRVASLAEMVGPGNLVSFLRFTQLFLNLLPPVRKQGNKFFCAISKKDLQPWIESCDGQCRLKTQTLGK